jgi:integrase
MPKKRGSGEGSVRKRADGRWEARWTDPRETDPKKRPKSHIDKSQKAVIQVMKAALAEIMEGTKLLSFANPSVSEWLLLWMKEYAINDLRDTTYESYERNIFTHINPLIGHEKVKELTGLQIQQMYNKMQEPKEIGGHGVGSWSVQKSKNILSGALKQAQISNIIRANPLIETSAPTPDDPDIQIMTKDEQKQYISVLSFFNTGNMFAVDLATGMRIGELCALEKSDIDRVNKIIDITKAASRRKDKHTGEISIKVGPPKTKYSVRKIPLLPSVEVMLDRQERLVEELKSLAGDNWIDNTLVFPTNTGKIHDLSGLRSAMGRILKRAGLPHMTIHALRHTYATTALNSGVAAQNVARLLGHKDGATTLKYYAHYINTEAFTQLQAMEEQNIKHLGLTSNELKQVTIGSMAALEKNNVAQQIGDVILRAKKMPPRKSIDMVLGVCEDILCQSLSDLTVHEKDVLLGALAQYTMMKRHYQQQDKKASKTKKPIEMER